MAITYEDLQKANALIQTTDVKGKEYAEVPQRVKAFRSLYPQGTITTEVVTIENGLCVIHATVSADGVILGEGTAYEKEGSSFINKTSYIENCVPLTTQILTNNGWKYYYQLGEDDLALSYNMKTRKMEFCKILRINRIDKASTIRLSTSRFNATCTMQHKWLAKTQCADITKVKTEDLTSSWKIVQAVRQDVEPSLLGRKLGWLMCDCEIKYVNGTMPSNAYICQSKHIDDITELFGEGIERKKYCENWMDSYEWNIKAEDVRAILGKFGIATYEDLPRAMLKANIEDVAGCYRSMMLADGSTRGFSSTYPSLIEAVQIMCARLGIATTFITSRMQEKSTRPIYTLGIKKTDGAYFSEMKVEPMPPHDVWCPTTENGTWVMREGTFVTLTSNCETSAVGRALGFAGFGIDASIASYEEVMNAKKQQKKLDEEELKAELKGLLQKTNSDVTAFLEWCSTKFQREIKAVDEMHDLELKEAIKAVKRKEK